MYVPTFGGSGLLHLLAAHPRVVAIFGVAMTVGALNAPHAPGRLVGTASHIEQIESAVRQMLRKCGAGCTDITTDRVIGDRALLVQVLMLSELDKLASQPKTDVAGARQSDRPTSATH